MYLTHNAYVLLVTLLGLYVLIAAGVKKSAFEWKRPSRVCPSCGRAAARCRCTE